MKPSFFILGIIGLLILASCSTEPQKIDFGSDACHFCKMTIVDSQHAAQYITTKGKQFKFDAVECMLNKFSEISTENIDVILVSDYANPGNMTDAKTAVYLISKEIKSPMGANLSAFSKESSAKEFVKIEDDQLFSWKTIKEKYSVK